MKSPQPKKRLLKSPWRSYVVHGFWRVGWGESRIGNGLLRSKEAFLLNRGEIEYRPGRQIL